MVPSILLMDDDAATAIFIADVLSEAGWSVQVAPSPPQALALLAMGPPPTLVIADSFAPSPDNPYLWLTPVRAATSAPIVICSAWPPEAFADYQAQGFAAVLAKPFDLEELTTLAEAFWTTTAGEAALAPDPLGA